MSATDTDKLTDSIKVNPIAIFIVFVASGFCGLGLGTAMIEYADSIATLLRFVLEPVGIGYEQSVKTNMLLGVVIGLVGCLMIVSSPIALIASLFEKN